MINSRISSTSNLMKTIRSKYDGSYSYDDKKVEIKKDEVFILIKKASQDWYLCIRINEPDKPFFVPSTYVEELSDNDVTAGHISTSTSTTPRNSSSKDNNNTTIIPSYYHSQDEQIDNNNDENIVAAGANNETVSVNSNKKLNGARISMHHDSSVHTAADDDIDDYDSPDYVNAIISDLDERLNLEYNDDVPSSQTQVPPKVKERKFINKMNAVETTTNEADIECVKTPEPDYDNIDYENAVQSRNRMQKLSGGSSEGRSTRKTVPIPPEPDYSDEDELNDNDEDNEDDVNANDDGGEGDNDTVEEEEEDDGEEDDDDDDDDDEDDEEDNTRFTNLTVTHTDAVEEQQQDVVFRDRKTTTTTTTATNTDKRLLDANVVIPEGWQQSTDVYQRSVFTNPITKEKWFLAFNSDGKAYFYDDKQKSLWHLPEIINNDQNNNSKTNNEGTHFSKKLDEGLTTFNHLHKRASEVSSKPSDEFASSQTPQISYTYKTKNILSDKFKIVQLLENGKKCKSKKNSEHYRIDLASSKLLFIKESTKQHSKLDFHLDFKGGSCFKLNIKDKNHQRIADGLKGFSKTDLKNTFLVETLNGCTVAFTHESSAIIDEWVSAINSMIKQIQSEFSPIYEEPGSLHLVKLENDKYFNPNLNYPTSTASSSTTTNSNKKGGGGDKDESVSCTYNSDDNELADNYNNNNNESDDNDSPIDDINSNFGSTMQLVQKHKEEKSKKNAKKDKNNKSSDNSNNKKQKSPKTSKKKESAEIQIQYHKSLSTAENERVASTAEIKINKKSTNTDSTTAANNSNAATNTATSNAFKAKLKEYLIAFFKRRPSLEYLKQKNIIQECIFGGSLMNICLKERRSVPTFVDEIIKAIEKKGLDMDGIYRISGNLAEVQKLRIQVNQGKYNFSDCDIHVLTGALKTFFRELEDPLVPVAMQEGFLNAIKNKDKTKKFQQIKELISNMPLPHRDTTHRLFSHLLKVIELRSVNRMHLQNIALVFGPTLLRINPLNATNNGFSENIILQNDLVEYILMHFNELFDTNH